MQQRRKDKFEGKRKEAEMPLGSTWQREMLVPWCFEGWMSRHPPQWRHIGAQGWAHKGPGVACALFAFMELAQIRGWPSYMCPFSMCPLLTALKLKEKSLHLYLTFCCQSNEKMVWFPAIMTLPFSYQQRKINVTCQDDMKRYYPILAWASEIFVSTIEIPRILSLLTHSPNCLTFLQFEREEYFGGN